MKLLDRYAKEFEHLKNPALKPLLQDILVIDPRTDTFDSVDPKKTILVGEQIPPHLIIGSFQKWGVEHFVQVDREGFIYDLFAASLMLKKPTAFMKNPLPFFVNHFKPDAENKDNVRSTTLSLGSSEEKSPILHQVTSFLSENQKTSNFIEAVHMIADEMIMNALYNGPVDGEGRAIFMDTDRARVVELPDNKKAKIFITHDNRQLLIGCADPFGSVNRYKILNQLSKVTKPGKASSPNDGTGGAGLGTKMMIDNSIGYYMVVKKNSQTLVCCALPLGVSYRKAERMSKNLHMVFF